MYPSRLVTLLDAKTRERWSGWTRAPFPSLSVCQHMAELEIALLKDFILSEHYLFVVNDQRLMMIDF